MDATPEQLRALLHHPVGARLAPRLAAIAPDPAADVDTQLDQVLDRYHPNLVATMLGLHQPEPAT